jgi:hypothetical protein
MLRVRHVRLTAPELVDEVAKSLRASFIGSLGSRTLSEHR